MKNLAEISLTETYWSTQAMWFVSEVSPTVILANPFVFGLFLDSNKVQKFGGRINKADQQAANLMPSKHHVVELPIQDVHKKIMYSRTSDTLCTIRERFWILKGRQVVKRCTFCNGFKGIPYSFIRSPDLSAVQVPDELSFIHMVLTM